MFNLELLCYVVRFAVFAIHPPSDSNCGVVIDNAGCDQAEDSHCLRPLLDQQAHKGSGVGQHQQWRSERITPCFVRTIDCRPSSPQDIDGSDGHAVKDQSRADHRIRRPSNAFLRRLECSALDEKSDEACTLPLPVDATAEFAFGSHAENSNTRDTAQTA